MVLRGIEAALERLVEGTFSRAFKSELQPVELGKRLIKELDSSKKLDVNGRSIAPNHFLLNLAPSDFESFTSIEGSLVKELTSTARTYAREKDLGFVGPLEILIEADERLKVGMCNVHPTFDETLDEEAKSGAVLEGLAGVTYDLYLRDMVIGRGVECDVVLVDENVSRRHAQLLPSADTFEISDLGSTNGIRVNGNDCGRAVLKDGDELEVGTVKLWFRQ